MKTSTNITLPKDQTPIFPDKCIVCHAKPTSTTKAFKSSTNAWLAFIFPPVQLFDWMSVKVPICRSCKFRFHFQDWGREVAFWVYLIIVFIWLIPNLDGWSQITKLFIIGSIILIAIIPYMLLDHFWPRILSFESSEDAVTYEFASNIYASEFEKSNLEIDIPHNEAPSFWDVVRHPELMPKLPDIRKNISDKVALLVNSPDEIAKLVDLYVFENDGSISDWQNKQILNDLDALAHPRALEILKDKSLHEKLVVMAGTDQSKTPISRLCELFDKNAPPPREATHLLLPFITSENYAIRRSIALIIGSIGSEEDLAILNQLLNDKDENVRSFVFIGLLRAINGKRISPITAEKLFDLIAMNWSSKTSFYENEKIPKVLLGLNREKGIKLLLSSSIFTAKFNSLQYVLAAFNELAIKIPREQLLQLISDIEKETLEYPLDYLLSEALKLLGTYQEEDDLHLFEIYLEHPNEKITNGAIEGLYKFHQFYDKIRNHWDARDSFGWEGITTAERYLCALDALKGEVSNGGFAQYYFNSASDQWKTALSGLHAIHAIEYYQIMEETVTKFPNNTPNPNRESRSTQLSKITLKKEDPFADQDSAWYALTNRKINLLTFKYNLANTKDRSKTITNNNN